MGKDSPRVRALIYVALMIAIIVGVDVALFRSRLWGRLIANVGMVVVFAAFSRTVLRRS